MADTVLPDSMEKVGRLELTIGPERQHRFSVVLPLPSLALDRDILNPLI